MSPNKPKSSLSVINNYYSHFCGIDFTVDIRLLLRSTSYSDHPNPWRMRYFTLYYIFAAHALFLVLCVVHSLRFSFRTTGLFYNSLTKILTSTCPFEKLKILIRVSLIIGLSLKICGPTFKSSRRKLYHAKYTSSTMVRLLNMHRQAI